MFYNTIINLPHISNNPEHQKEAYNNRSYYDFIRGSRPTHCFLMNIL